MTKGNDGPVEEPKVLSVDEEKKMEDERRLKALASAIPESVLSEISFEDLKDQLSQETLTAIREMGFSRMTEIQSKSIPQLLQGRCV